MGRGCGWRDPFRGFVDVLLLLFLLMRKVDDGECPILSRLRHESRVDLCC